MTEQNEVLHMGQLFATSDHCTMHAKQNTCTPMHSQGTVYTVSWGVGSLLESKNQGLCSCVQKTQASSILIISVEG